MRVWWDPLTRKSFHNEATYLNFVRSKKYQDLVGGPKFILAGPVTGRANRTQPPKAQAAASPTRADQQPQQHPQQPWQLHVRVWLVLVPCALFYSFVQARVAADVRPWASHLWLGLLVVPARCARAGSPPPPQWSACARWRGQRSSRCSREVEQVRARLRQGRAKGVHRVPLSQTCSRLPFTPTLTLTIHVAPALALPVPSTGREPGCPHTGPAAAGRRGLQGGAALRRPAPAARGVCWPVLVGARAEVEDVQDGCGCGCGRQAGQG